MTCSSKFKEQPCICEAGHKGEHVSRHPHWGDYTYWKSEEEDEHEMPIEPRYCCKCGYKENSVASMLTHVAMSHNVFGTEALDFVLDLVIEKTLTLDDKTRNFNGVTSTKLPRLELIPKSTLESLALRFELGIERKGDGAWNALTNHKREAITNKDFVIERLAHCIHHCYDAIRKVNDGNELNGEDDAGAILFAGSVLAEYRAERKPKE